MRELDVGSRIIEEAVKNLPATKKHAQYLWSLVLKLSKKLAYGGVDDSDGMIGGCISSIVKQCGRYVKEKPKLKQTILHFIENDTGFGFEDELREVL